MFGFSVALEGNVGVVGVPGQSVSGDSDIGEVIIIDATTGAVLQTLLNPNPDSGDEPGHPAIHDHHVRSECIGKHEGFLAITGKPDDLDVRVGVQQHPVSLTHDLVVIDHQDLDFFRCYCFGSHCCLLGRPVELTRCRSVRNKLAGFCRRKSCYNLPTGQFRVGITGW